MNMVAGNYSPQTVFLVNVPSKIIINNDLHLAAPLYVTYPQVLACDVHTHIPTLHNVRWYLQHTPNNNPLMTKLTLTSNPQHMVNRYTNLHTHINISDRLSPRIVLTYSAIV